MAFYVQKDTVPAKATYGHPRIAVNYVPNPGEEFIVHRERADLQVDQEVTISPPGWDMPGRVIQDLADDPYYQDQKLCGGRVKNGGKGYYKIRVLDIPR